MDTNTKEHTPLLLTVREVGILLRVQRPKVYELIRNNILQGFKLGADWRIRRDSVEALVGEIPVGFFDRNEELQEEEEAA